MLSFHIKFVLVLDLELNNDLDIGTTRCLSMTCVFILIMSLVNELV